MQGDFLMKIKPYLDLCRVSNLPTVWTNVLCAIILTGETVSLHHFLTLALSISLFYSAGMCLNDIYDLEEDRTRRPSRPLPSGKVTLRSASAFMYIMFGAALLLLAFVPHPRAVFAGLFLLAAIVFYDKFHKAHLISVLVMAMCRLMVFVVSSIAVAGSVGKLAAMGGALQFTYILIISITARYENSRKQRYSFPVIPYMLAGISLLDGIIMAVFVSPGWLAAGIAGTLLTLSGQRFVRGD